MTGRTDATEDGETGGGETGDPDRLARGLALLRRLGSRGLDGPIGRLARLSPDMAAFTIAYPYGDVLSRPGLDLRLRQICTVGALIARESVRPQLEFHIGGLLTVGGSPFDLAEILDLAAGLLGLPAAIAALGSVRRIVTDRGLSLAPIPPADDHAGGARLFLALIAADATGDAALFTELPGRLAAAAPAPETKARRLAAISMLAAIGNRDAALADQLAGALAVGATVDAIIEALIQISVYAGFPAALNAFGVAGNVLEPSPAPTRAPVLPGDIGHGHPLALDPRTRALAACAALAARGTAAAEAALRAQIPAALAAGASRAEILATLSDIAAPAGDPAARRALAIAAAEFAGLAT